MKKVVPTILVILALISIFIAIIYFTKPASNLPHFYPGYSQGSSHKHVKHAVAFIGLSAILFLSAWMVSGQDNHNKYLDKNKITDVDNEIEN